MKAKTTKKTEAAILSEVLTEPRDSLVEIPFQHAITVSRLIASIMYRSWTRNTHSVTLHVRLKPVTVLAWCTPDLVQKHSVHCATIDVATRVGLITFSGSLPVL